MSISAKTLFHFTNFDSLKGILQNGFYPRCSVEQVAFSTDLFPVAIPMVSFCDIKFSQLSDHLDTYGHYAIGLTKNWGIKSGINPVFYIESDTRPHKLIKTMVKAYFKLVDFERNQLNLTVQQRIEFIDLLQLIAYCKINNTKKWDKTNNCFFGPDINYYDEREWRYFPGIKHSDNPNYLALPFIPMINLQNSDAVRAMGVQDDYAKEKALKFITNDIRYLIVKGDDEIEELISFLRHNNLFQEHFDILISKISSVERISDDH